MGSQSPLLTGFHHLTAVTAKAARNYGFYTQVMGLRLVKKTVNQDDVSAYHLYYADKVGSAGTDITFFDWPAAPERRGTRSVTQTAFRVPAASLAWWKARFADLRITHGQIHERDGREAIDFEDPEGQRLGLVADGSAAAANPWERSPVPAEHQLVGLGPIRMSVPDLRLTDQVLTEVLSMKHDRTYTLNPGKPTNVHVYTMNAAGPAGELHVAVEPDAMPARPGAGGVHHVAFRTPNDAEYDAWSDRLVELGMPTSGPVDRFYFRSLYFREPGGVLFEIATDGPGFATDEKLETLGESLALPPVLEERRAEIERGLKPLAT